MTIIFVIIRSDYNEVFLFQIEGLADVSDLDSDHMGHKKHMKNRRKMMQRKEKYDNRLQGIQS